MQIPWKKVVTPKTFKGALYWLIINFFLWCFSALILVDLNIGSIFLTLAVFSTTIYILWLIVIVIKTIITLAKLKDVEMKITLIDTK